MTANAVAEIWQDIRAHLEARKRAITMEIRNYPQPIAGCDAQIPALWEARDALVRELNRLDDAANAESPDAVAAFLATSPCVDEEARTAFRARLPAPATAE